MTLTTKKYSAVFKGNYIVILTLYKHIHVWKIGHEKLYEMDFWAIYMKWKTWCAGYVNQSMSL